MLQRKPAVSRIRQLLTLLLLGLTLFYGLEQAFAFSCNGDFVPVNGDFQNFNPVRRLLDGQVPYKDFTDYLGAGHLFLGSLFTALFGGTYAASMAAFHFLTYLTSFGFFIVVGLSILRKLPRRRLVVLGIFIVYLALACWLPKAVLPFSLRETVSASMAAGNSAYFVRSAVMLVYVLCVWLSLKILHRRPRKHMAVLETVIAGVFGGIAAPWSNDFGLACVLCAGLIVTYYSLVRDKKPLRAIHTFLIYFVTAALSALLTVTVISGGHPAAYLSSMLGSGAYQGWYFGINSGSQNYLWQVDKSPFVWLEFALILLYAFLIARKKGADETRVRYGVPLFLNLCAFAAANEYHILSGGSSNEVSILLTLLTVCCELLLLGRRLLMKLSRLKGKRLPTVLRLSAGSAAVLILVALVVSFSIKLADYYPAMAKREPFEKLGTSMVKMEDSVRKGVSFAEGKRLFSLYASAVEVETQQFQPSGTDYIIHVLGDEARKDYLSAFNNERFDYVTTIRDDYNLYTGWIENANWYIYRELYASYCPVYQTGYQVFWQKAPELSGAYCADIPVRVTVSPAAAPSCCELLFNADESINGIADVYIKYSLDKDGSFKSNLIVRKYVAVQNTDSYWVESECSQNYLLPEQGELHIPVQLIDGQCTVQLQGYPEGETILSVSEVTVESVLTMPYRYITAESAVVVSEDAVQCTVCPTARDVFALQKATALRRGEESYSIVSLEALADGKYLLTLQTTPAQSAGFADSLLTANCFILSEEAP